MSASSLGWLFWEVVETFECEVTSCGSSPVSDCHHNRPSSCSELRQAFLCLSDPIETILKYFFQNCRKVFKISYSQIFLSGSGLFSEVWICGANAFTAFTVSKTGHFCFYVFCVCACVCLCFLCLCLCLFLCLCLCLFLCSDYITVCFHAGSSSGRSVPFLP